jgi:putative hydrolase of the HAD superfamily
MIEIAVELTEEKIHPADIRELIRLAKEMLSHDVIVFEGVQSLLEELSADFPLMLITKGDLLHQQRKYQESGLASYFRAVEVVSEKNQAVYGEILERYDIEPERFLMIGNSLRSDVLPLLEIGAWGLHLADHSTWSHEDDPHNELKQERYLEAEDITKVLETLRDKGLIEG